MAKKYRVLNTCALLITSIFLGILLQHAFFSQSQSVLGAFSGPTFKNCPYHYINPLRCEPDKISKTSEYPTLRNDVLDYILTQKQEGSLVMAAVYFRDLENGPIIEINDQEKFFPASLLKVPLLITYLKKAQDTPSILQRKIIVAGNFQSLPKQNITPQQSAAIGGEYTIDALLTLLITQSDNISWQTLLTDLNKNYSENDFIATLNDLGISDPRKSINEQSLSVQEYASIFRILYNSSYLNIPMSNKALALLTQADFPNGIVAGVPTDVKVAHKFGESIEGRDAQLHDCGIVYYPHDPYILCVMTKGYDLSSLEQVVQQISQDVFTAVKNSN